LVLVNYLAAIIISQAVAVLEVLAAAARVQVVSAAAVLVQPLLARLDQLIQAVAAAVLVA
jgi:hypothetical protein